MLYLQLSFILIVMLALGFWKVASKHKASLLLYSFWCLLIGILSYKEFFLQTNTLPPRGFLLIVPQLIFVPWIVFKTNISSVSIKYFLWLHVLRLPIELVLHQLYLSGLIPISMTFEGWNYDILIGISALWLALVFHFYPQSFSPKIFLYWNYWGLTSLAIIVATAIVSAPFPFQLLSKEMPNRAILYFPFALLPAVVVPLVCAAHIVSIRWCKKVYSSNQIN